MTAAAGRRLRRELGGYLAVRAGLLALAALVLSQWPAVSGRPPQSGGAARTAPPAAAIDPLQVPGDLRPATGPVPAPSEIEIPRIGLASRLVRLGSNPDGSIQTPGDPGLAGWFAGGPAPGGTGPAVVLGHLDSDTGPAVFWRLGQLRSGDLVLVYRADGSTVGFVVSRVARFARSGFPSQQVYGPTPAPELRLITCGGWFDDLTRQYSDNLVVFARLAP